MSSVSVIIPSYNHARFVTQAVVCALNQTHRDVEVIVVDDGSRDCTRDVLVQFGDRICYVYQDNQGVSATRNHGIRVSRGDYLLFLDADDLIPSNKLEVQAALLDAHPEWGAVYCAWQYVDETAQNVLGELRLQKQGVLLRELLLRQFSFPPSAPLIRRQCFDAVGSFDTKLSGAADTDLWLRFAHAGIAFGYADEVLLQYRMVDNSMSHNFRRQMDDELRRLDKFYARTDLSAEAQALREQAYATLHYEYAARLFAAGDVECGQAHVHQAIAACPELAQDELWLLNWLGGFVTHPEVKDPKRCLALIFDSLPPEATTLSKLRHEAVGAYHVNAAFNAYRNQRFRDVVPHLLPGVTRYPAILRNRGFLKIGMESLLRMVSERSLQHGPAAAMNEDD